MTSAYLLERIKTHEGFRPQMYRCTAGKATIGYGRNLDDCGITLAEGVMMLRTDVRRATEDLDLLLRIQGVDTGTLRIERYEVLVEMVFNLGLTRIRKFRKMWRAIALQEWETASCEMLDSKWAKQVGQRAVTLAVIMRDGWIA